MNEITNKIVTAEQAVTYMQGAKIAVFSHAAGMPIEIIKEMCNQSSKFNNLKVFHMLGLGDGEYMQKAYKDNFRHITNFVGANSRNAVIENRADFSPCYFHEVPTLFSNDIMSVDVAVIHISYPNEDGFCSYGISCDYTKPAAENAKIVIAEMNKQMPYVKGDNFIHISDIDYIVETDNPIYTIDSPKLKETEICIGKYCADLIEDESTLQLGIGSIPDAVMDCLCEKKNLGIHSEMISDGVEKLFKMGVITGSAKTIHKEKMVATFIMGTSNFYDFINNNENIELHPVNYVNDPYVIAQNNKMVSINSCIEIDLMGQVNSETIGLTQYSGVGGQIDFIRGASMSKGGKSILAIPSTAAKGKLSRIVPFLTHGAAITTSRNDIDYVVTEFGIAKLKYKTLKQRAKELINVSHPQFRDELNYEYKKRFE
ncbi:MAG: acetyl-CoA hydrolase/transferase family protein [Bacteroidales bacterium]|jgi:4-hydroxybutyrate CoA-transferase